MHRIASAETHAPVQSAASNAGKREPRADSWRPGTLSFPSGERIDVVVKNINASGARIEFVRSTHLPERVRLSAQGASRWAYVVWQGVGAAGLRFVGSDRS